MNRDDVIRWAREAGMRVGTNLSGVVLVGSPAEIGLAHLTIEELEHLANAAFAAGAAAERNRIWNQEDWTEYERGIAAAAKAEENEACAQFLESTQLGSLPDDTALHYARLLKGFAEGIRARGQL